MTDDRSSKLLEAGLALSAELSLPTLLQRIIDVAAEVTGARYGALGVLGTEGDRLVDFITTGVTPEQRAAIGPLPQGRGILGVLIRDARPLRLRDIATDPRTSGFPPNHPPMHSFLGAPVRAHGQVFGNIYLTEKRGATEFSDDDEATLMILASQAGIAISNARLYEQARLHERWLDAFRDTATAILAGSASIDVLRLVARRARELVEADIATIATPAQDGELRIAVAEGDGNDIGLEGMEIPVEGSLSGQVLHSGRSVVVDDAAAAAGTYQPMVAKTGAGPMIFAPLSLRGRTFGTLAVGNRVGGRRFSAQDASLLETFADQASLVLEYGRVQRELSRLALVEDRERIAKDLHDGVIQSLFAVGLGLQGAAGLIADANASHRVNEAIAEIDRVIGDLRGYIFGLRPAVLAAGRLTDGLSQLCHEFEQRSGITTVVDMDPSLEEPLAPSATDIVQFVREALSNVGRHSGAATCRVSLRREREAAVLEIDDDGKGFDPAATTTGMGLGNLSERAAAMGARLRMDSSATHGTTVTIAIPLTD